MLTIPPSEINTTLTTRNSDLRGDSTTNHTYCRKGTVNWFLIRLLTEEHRNYIACLVYLIPVINLTFPARWRDRVSGVTDYAKVLLVQYIPWCFLARWV